MSKQRLIAYGMLFATTVIWGIATPVIKFTLPAFPALLFLTYRFFLTSLLLLPILAISVKEKIPTSPRQFWMIILVGILGSSINLGLLFGGLTYTTSIAGSLLSATSPVLVVLAGAFFLKEYVTKKEKLGLIIAFVGSLIIALSPAAIQEENIGSILGNLMILAANISWVAYVILAKVELQHRYSPLFLITTSFFIGFLTLLPAAIIQQGSIESLVNTIASQPISAHLGVLYMAFISGALAYWLYQEGQRRIEASEATIFSYLSPIFAAPLALLWLHETITPLFLLGAIIIAVGVVIAEYKKRRYNKRL